MSEPSFRRFQVGVAGAADARFTIELDTEDDSHRVILAHWQAGTMYEAETTHTLMRVLGPGDCFVDVGANAGHFSLLARMLVGEAGQVLAVEANPDNAALLRRNITLNGFGNIAVLPVAAAAVPGRRDFVVTGDSAGSGRHDSNGALAGRSDERAPAGRRIEVAAAPLDQIIGAVRPKAIKIDTEGAELEVLRGAAALLARREVPFIIAELNVLGLFGYGESPDALRRYMQGFGYDTFLMAERGDLPTLVPAAVEIRPIGVGNVLFATIDAVAAHWRWVDYLPPWHRLQRGAP